MEKEGDSQLELFSGIRDSAKSPKERRGSFFGYMHKYEKAILVIICSISIAIISFSLGVERGRRIALINSDAHFDIAAKVALPSPVNIPNQYQPVIQKQNQPLIKNTEAIKPQQIKESTQKYTIQVASYQTKKYAQQEAELLRKKGLNPLLIFKGKYTVLCVGNFSNQQEARALLSEIKGQKRYASSIIRRL